MTFAGCFSKTLTSSLLLMSMIFLNMKFVQAADDEFFESGQSSDTNPGIALIINPDRLFDHALSRAWRNIHDLYGKFHIQSRPLSKVNFNLTPLPASQGAVVSVRMKGVSAGTTHNSTDKFEIVSDALTRFQAKQLVHLSMDGIGFSPAEIEVKTNQSFNRTIAKKGGGFAAAMASFSVKNFPRDVHCKAQPFARKQVEQQLANSMSQLELAIHDSVNQLHRRHNWLTTLPWNISSDSKHVFLFSSSYGEAPSEIKAPINSAIAIRLNDQFINQQFAQLANETWSSEQIANRLNALTDSRVATSETTDPWSITFAEQPIRFKFDKDQIGILFNIDEFKTDTKSFQNTRIILTYSINTTNDRWILERSDALGIRSNSRGARQQMVRSIIRKRIDGLFPKHISIPEIHSSSAMKKMDLNLEIRRIVSNNHSLMMSIDHQ